MDQLALFAPFTAFPMLSFTRQNFSSSKLKNFGRLISAIKKKLNNYGKMQWECFNFLTDR